MAMYAEPGRARKPCPKCLGYMHVRSRVCDCGHSFSDIQLMAVVKEQTFYTEPGQGRKLCQGCKKYVGVRTKNCGCGFDFNNAVAQVAATPSDPITAKSRDIACRLGYPHFKVILTPRGKCPHKPKELDQIAIRNWVNLVMVDNYEQVVYSPSALKYFLREWYNYGTANYKKACGFVDECIMDEITDAEASGLEEE